MTGQKDDDLMIGLYACSETVNGGEDILPGRLGVALPVVSEQAYVVFGNARGTGQQVFNRVRVFAGISEFLNLAGVIADADQQRPLVVRRGLL